MNETFDVKELYLRIRENVLSVFVGSEQVIRPVLLGFLSGMHVLLEDIPGVGKTTLALSLAKSCDLDFARIQFTPDLLPGDIIGMSVWDSDQREFRFKPGAISHQFILGDEINRASERTQSALLEAMAETSVTVDGNTYRLPEPFFVIATQNPVSFAGTFLLPESQTDRFGLSTALGYPTPESERLVLTRFQETNPLDNLKPACSSTEILAARQAVRKISINDAVKDYIIEISGATRRDSRYRLAISPRGSRHLMIAAQANAAIEGRTFVIPEDITSVAEYVLGHRIRLSSDARNADLKPTQVIRETLKTISKPSGL